MLFMFNHISTIERDDDPYNSDYIIFLGCGSTTKQMWDCSHTKKWQVFLFVMLHDVAFSLLLNPSKTSIGWCVCAWQVPAHAGMGYLHTKLIKTVPQKWVKSSPENRSPDRVTCLMLWNHMEVAATISDFQVLCFCKICMCPKYSRFLLRKKGTIIFSHLFCSQIL